MGPTMDPITITFQLALIVTCFARLDGGDVKTTCDKQKESQERAV